MSQEKVIEVKNLDKVYRSGTHAVKGISFDVMKGEIFGMLGPNGVGKSTIFNLVTGLISPEKGSIFIGGEKVHGRSGC